MARVHVVRVPFEIEDPGVDDPETGPKRRVDKGAILAHPAHVDRIDGDRHLRAHCHATMLPDDHPEVARWRQSEEPQPASRNGNGSRQAKSDAAPAPASSAPAAQ